jgi:hypothetical protein
VPVPGTFTRFPPGHWLELPLDAVTSAWAPQRSSRPPHSIQQAQPPPLRPHPSR